MSVINHVVRVIPAVSRDLIDLDPESSLVPDLIRYQDDIVQVRDDTHNMVDDMPQNCVILYLIQNLNANVK